MKIQQIYPSQVRTHKRTYSHCGLLLISLSSEMRMNEKFVLLAMRIAFKDENDEKYEINSTENCHMTHKMRGNRDKKKQKEKDYMELGLVN